MINPWRTIKHLAFPVTHGFGKAKLLMGSDRIDVALPPCDEEAVAMGSLFDAFAVASLTRTLRPKVCFEIGTYLGRSTLAMALNSGDDCVIHTLDQADGPHVGSAFRGRPEARKIRQLFGDSTEFSFAPYAGKVDFVLVDGGPEYDAASKDTENAFRILSPGGMILWHDFSPDWPGWLRRSRSPGDGAKSGGSREPAVPFTRMALPSNLSRC